jgi:hypothetical protein
MLIHDKKWRDSVHKLTGEGLSEEEFSSVCDRLNDQLLQDNETPADSLRELLRVVPVNDDGAVHNLVVCTDARRNESAGKRNSKIPARRKQLRRS